MVAPLREPEITGLHRDAAMAESSRKKGGVGVEYFRLDFVYGASLSGAVYLGNGRVLGIGFRSAGISSMELVTLIFFGVLRCFSFGNAFARENFICHFHSKYLELQSTGFV